MIRTTVSVALAACLLLVVASSAAAKGEDWSVQAIAVKHYTDTHPGVSADEALRRLELQDGIAGSIPEIAAALGDRYAGAWFDAEDGGRLKVALVGRDSKAAAGSIADARGVLAKIDRADAVEFVNADWTLAELKAAQLETTRALAEARGAQTSVAIDVAANVVDVTRSSEAPAATTGAIAQARAATAVPVRQTLVNGPYKPEPKGCTMPYCDRPLRGGVKTFIDVAGHAGGYLDNCTTGFNVTSRSDGKRYVLTAGHCVNLSDIGYPSTGSHLHGTKHVTGGVVNEIGPGHSSSFPGGGDAGIIRAKVPSYWQQSPFPTNTLVVDALPGVTGYQPDYQILSEADAPAGQVVCTTGGGGTSRFWEGTQYASWTWCGTVRYTAVSVDYGSAGFVHNLVETDICLFNGMSGGPVYKWNVAYAVNSGSSCTSTVARGWHYPSIRAENDLNVNIVH